MGEPKVGGQSGKGGYRCTDVGTIPADWDVRRLAEVTDRITVGIASAATHAYRPRGIALLRNQNIKPGFLDDREVLYVDPAYEQVFRNKRLREGDLLTARTGYPGMTCVVPDSYDGAQSFTTLISRPKRDVVDSHFLCHFVNSSIGQAFFERSQIGGAQKNVNAGTLRGMPVPLPELNEQRIIAAALADVDALLGALERLIAKRRDLRQGVQQCLVSGRARLRGFYGQWEIRRLGDVATMSSGGTPPAGVRGYYGGDVPWVSISDITAGGKFIARTERSLTRLGLLNSAAVVYPAGAVLYAMYASIGECAIAAVPVSSSQAILGIRPGPTIDAEFLYYWLCAQRGSVKRLGQQGTQANLNAGMVREFRLPVPSLAEQASIAAVLSDMDAEIAALERRREKTHLLKQGMMQELLTGRTRLV